MIVSKDADETIRLRLEMEVAELEELYVALLIGRKTDHQKGCLRTLALELENAQPGLVKLRPAEKADTKENGETEGKDPD